MRAMILSLILVSVFASVAEARNPQRDINDAVNGVLDANISRNISCWEGDGRDCRRKSGTVAERCQKYMRVGREVKGTGIYVPNTVEIANAICTRPYSIVYNDLGDYNLKPKHSNRGDVFGDLFNERRYDSHRNRWDFDNDRGDNFDEFLGKAEDMFKLFKGFAQEFER